jgi:phosphohistidine swiveling domain-containing protein
MTQIILSNANSGEAVFGALGKLSQSLVKPGVDDSTSDVMERLGARVLDRNVMYFVAGRPYLSVNFMAQTIANVIPGWSPESLGVSQDLLAQVIPSHGAGQRILGLLGMGPRLVRFLRRLSALGRETDHWLAEEMPAYCADLAQLRDTDLSTWSDEQLLVRNHEIVDHNVIAFYHLATTLSFTFYVSLLEQLVTDRESFTVLLSGLPGMSAAEMSWRIWRMAWVASQSAEVRKRLESLASGDSAGAERVLAELRASATGQEFIAEYDQFLEHCGYRGFSEADFAVPRFEDEPAFILALVKGYLDRATEGNPLEAQRATREARTAEILGALAGPQRLIAARVLPGAQRLSSQRENTKDIIALRQVALRNLYLELGRRLVARGVLTEAEDINHLTDAQVDQAILGELSPIEVQTLVAQHRQEYESDQAASPPMVVIMEGDTWHETAEVAAEVKEGRLTGLPASRGRVTAQARVVLTPQEGAERLEPGEILVTPQTDPAWTVLFLKIGAVVTELGGVGSHAAIVAREYGLPAIVGVGGATSLIRDGQRITVDGTQGMIILHET